VQVSLEILDVNDNSPVFPTTFLVRQLSESSPVGTTLTIDSATDRDTAQFGVRRYELRPADEPAAQHFQLKVLSYSNTSGHSTGSESPHHRGCMVEQELRACPSVIRVQNYLTQFAMLDSLLVIFCYALIARAARAELYYFLW